VFSLEDGTLTDMVKPRLYFCTSACCLNIIIYILFIIYKYILNIYTSVPARVALDVFAYVLMLCFS
jgi:hypothetical protein